MRLRVAASESMSAALALSRAMRVTPREVLLLLRAPVVLPCDFEPDTAAALARSLGELGVAAELVDVPASAGRCASHPSLTNDAQCERCRKSVCPLCQPLCRTCGAAEARARRWKRVRVAVLLVVLGGVAVFAAAKQRAQASRHSWLRPLRVSVVLVSAQPVGAAELQAWSDGAQELQRWVKEMTGAELPIVTEGDPKKDALIVLGVLPANTKKAGKAIGAEGYVLETAGPSLLVQGGGQQQDQR